MTDEIASFKVTAADIQEQEKPPSGDGHMTPAAILAWLATDGRYHTMLSNTTLMVEIQFNPSPVL